MARDTHRSYIKMNRILLTLVDKKKLNEEDCDLLLIDFNYFLTNVANKYPVFSYKEQRHDSFLKNHLCKYPNLWHVCQLLLILSHGQAVVE